MAKAKKQRTGGYKMSYLDRCWDLPFKSHVKYINCNLESNKTRFGRKSIKEVHLRMNLISWSECTYVNAEVT